MTSAETVVTEFKVISGDYVYNPSVFSQEETRVARLKWILDHRLNRVDRTIILLYAEYGSLRKLGARLRLSKSTVGKEVQRIKENILQLYNSKLPIDE